VCGYWRGAVGGGVGVRVCGCWVVLWVRECGVS
jgi:hypothetical protein